MICSICSESISKGQPYLDEVTGWAKYRGKTGGANAIVKPVYSGRVAHEVCVKSHAEIQGALL